jgi:hypothetical protein
VVHTSSAIISAHSTARTGSVCAGSVPIMSSSWGSVFWPESFDDGPPAPDVLHNLADTTVTVDIGAQPGMNGNPYDLFVDGPYPAPTEKLTDLTLNGWGYRWIRLSRSDRG